MEKAGGGLSFDGIRAFFVEVGVQRSRLQIWSRKLQQLGARVEHRFSRTTTHLFCIDHLKLQESIDLQRLKKHKVNILKYDWIEDCLKAGFLLPTESYSIQGSFTGRSSTSSDKLDADSCDNLREGAEAKQRKGEPSSQGIPHLHDSKDSEGPRKLKQDDMQVVYKESNEECDFRESRLGSIDNNETCSESHSHENHEHSSINSLIYSPPNLNRNITDLFTELKDTYKYALGDERRSFSYYKAISVLEKLPYKIMTVDQVKGLPSVGKSLQDQITEILTTGTISRLENFKKDQKVCALSLFGSIWGFGPMTAQKVYEKGYRNLQDLKNEPSLTAAQKIGLQFHHDINKIIPRHEVAEMVEVVKKGAQELDSEIMVVCGGSYRRGRAFCGDMDFVITHPDGQSHKGFLRKLVTLLKQRDFLTEDLLYAHSHSLEGTESGVDSYFGLCKYPGREQRHRIDMKVYPIEIYPFGLVAWTGNDILNRRVTWEFAFGGSWNILGTFPCAVDVPGLSNMLRLSAEAKGYKLDDKGLYPVVIDSHGQKVAMRSSSIPCKTEKDIFEILGFPWLEANERNL